MRNRPFVEILSGRKGVVQIFDAKVKGIFRHVLLDALDHRLRVLELAYVRIEEIMKPVTLINGFMRIALYFLQLVIFMIMIITTIPTCNFIWRLGEIGVCVKKRLSMDLARK